MLRRCGVAIRVRVRVRVKVRVTVTALRCCNVLELLEFCATVSMRGIIRGTLQGYHLRWHPSGISSGTLSKGIIQGYHPRGTLQGHQSGISSGTLSKALSRASSGVSQCTFAEDLTVWIK